MKECWGFPGMSYFIWLSMSSRFLHIFDKQSTMALMGGIPWAISWTFNSHSSKILSILRNHSSIYQCETAIFTRLGHPRVQNRNKCFQICDLLWKEQQALIALSFLLCFETTNSCSFTTKFNYPTKQISKHLNLSQIWW